MKTFFKLSVTVILIWSVISAIAFAQTEIGTPYDNWSQFKPGSFVIYKTSVQAVGVVTDTQMTYTLKEVTPEKVVFEIKTVMETMGVKVENPGVTLELPKDGGGMPADMTGGVDMYNVVAEGSTVEQKQEKVKVKDQEFEATVIKVQTQDYTGKTTVDLWYSEEFPGGTIKSITKVEGAAPTTVEMTAIDFKVVK